MRVTTVVGFLINPIAGMGGRVGLKGTDGTAIQEEAVRRGASPTAAARASLAVRALATKGLDIRFLTCAGAMGGDLLSGQGLPFEVVHTPPAISSALDTKKAASAFLEGGAQVILFCGGDGTARDVVEAVGREAVVVGIPAGVKMHSSVFALRPGDAANLVESFARSGRTREGEVLDVDESDYRAGHARPRMFALALVPDDSAHLQASKSAYDDSTALAEAEEIGAHDADGMEAGVLYLVGPGSTTEAIARAIGQKKTPLGVDAYLDRRLVGLDLTERDITSLLEDHDRSSIIVTPIGAQGFVFGRGNQQLSPAIIRSVGRGGVIVVATPTKLRNTPSLHVDTGDAELDRELRGHVKVLVGAGRRKLMTIV